MTKKELNKQGVTTQDSVYIYRKGGSEGAPAGAAENDLPAEYLNSPLSQQPQVISLKTSIKIC